MAQIETAVLIDENLYKEIENFAQHEHLSLNTAIEKLVKERLHAETELAPTSEIAKPTMKWQEVREVLRLFREAALLGRHAAGQGLWPVLARIAPDSGCVSFPRCRP